MKFRFALLLGQIMLLLSFSGCIKTESSTERPDRITKPEIIDTTNQEEDSEFEALSVTGEPYFQQEFPARLLKRRERELVAAENNYNQYPDSLDYIIWYGRRLAYLSRYKDAIDIYSKGLELYPESYRLYRHRGHRFITVRKFDLAISDLEKAAFYSRSYEVRAEEDGISNAINKPLTTTQFNIWYHLGLAYYLKGNYDKAVSAFKKCMEASDNDDLLVATTDWLYMTYRKIGNKSAATALLEPIHDEMRIVENHSYHKRLLMYKGEIEPTELLNVSVTDDPDSQLALATQGYGVGFHYLVNGKLDEAREIFENVVSTNYWPAFGFIASEVELYNLSLAGAL